MLKNPQAVVKNAKKVFAIQFRTIVFSCITRIVDAEELV
jgi:hypothetical protein